MGLGTMSGLVSVCAVLEEKKDLGGPVMSCCGTGGKRLVGDGEGERKRKRGSVWSKYVRSN